MTECFSVLDLTSPPDVNNQSYICASSVCVRDEENKWVFVYLCCLTLVASSVLDLAEVNMP